MGALAQPPRLVPGVGAVVIQAGDIGLARSRLAFREEGFPSPLLAALRIEAALFHHHAVGILLDVGPAGHAAAALVVFLHRVVGMVGNVAPRVVGLEAGVYAGGLALGGPFLPGSGFLARGEA